MHAKKHLLVRNMCIINAFTAGLGFMHICAWDFRMLSTKIQCHFDNIRSALLEPVIERQMLFAIPKPNRFSGNI